MTALAAHALLSAIREVIEGGDVVAHRIDVGTYRSGAWALMDRDRESTLALKRPRAEARITRLSRSSVPTVVGCRGAGIFLYDVTVEVRVVRHVNNKHALDHDARTLVRALAAQDADVIARALTHPDNLAECEGGAKTCLSGGALVFQSSSIGDVELADDVSDGSRIVSVHTFTGTMQVPPGD